MELISFLEEHHVDLSNVKVNSIYAPSIIFSAVFFFYQTCFGNNYQTFFGFEIISSLLLSAFKNKSLPIYMLIIKVVSCFLVFLFSVEMCSRR